MGTKKCSKCKIIKDISFFSKNNKTKDKLHCSCKECDKEKYFKNREQNLLKMREYKKNNSQKIKDYYVENQEKQKQYRDSKKDLIKNYNKDYYKNNIEKRKKYLDETKEERKLKRKEHYEKNKEIILESTKKRNIQNKEKIQDYNKQYRENNLDSEKRRWKEYYEKNKNELIKKNSKKTKEKRNTVILEKLKHNVRNRLLFYLKVKNIRKNSKTFDIIGCSPDFLKQHLEKQFTEDMVWENYGYYGWHIDHIIPLSIAETEEELYKLSHFTNLQPMWASDNIKKGAKIL
jgi:hypothetical protein